MLEYFRKVLFHLNNRPQGDSGETPEESSKGAPPEEDTASSESSSINITRSLDKNLVIFKNIFAGSTDIITREFTFGQEPAQRAVLYFVDGLTDKASINAHIIKPLMYDNRFICESEVGKPSLDSFENSLLAVADVKKAGEINAIVDGCMSGDSILIIDGFDKALVISTRKWESRGIQEPQTEVVVRGPREGFCETLRINTSLLRRKIKTPDLILESMKIGRRTKTDICIAYIKGIANPSLIEEVKKRLNKIDTDSILESGYIEQYIEDSPFSLFPTVGYSEKPDVVAGKLLEGRAAIIVDGTPFVLTVPMLFVESFQTSEDYSLRYMFASTLRVFRYIAYFITLFAPAFYLVVLTFHPELIPTPLLFTLAASEEGLPFPMFLELFMMLIVFEILREAGVRLPRPVGQAISIVGALVIGQAAVAAGIVSDFTVIVIAITAVSSFVVPSQMESSIILRFVIFFLSALVGGFGIIVSLLGIIIYLCSLSSFNVPYLSPMAPLNRSGLKDFLFRLPLWKMTDRPESLKPVDLKRQADNQMPGVNDNAQ